MACIYGVNPNDILNRFLSPITGPAHWSHRLGRLSGPASLAPIMAGVDTAYYLVHSMGSPRQLVEIAEAQDGLFP